MKFTKNYGLKKPEQTDFYDVVHENDNMDILDEKLNEASHYQGNLSSTYEYDEGFVFGSEGDGKVWEIPRALKVVYDAVLNLASNGVGKNKNRVDKMEQVISRASNTWIIPDYLKDAIHYVCGAGTPEENGYSADDYNDENGYDEPYLDVISGTVYHAIRTKDSPLTYGWVVKEQLASVQDKAEVIDISDSITLQNGTKLFYAKYCNGKVDIRGVTNIELTGNAFKSLLSISEKYRNAEVINGEGVATNSTYAPWLVLNPTGEFMAAAKGGTIPTNGNVRFNLSYYVF